VRGKNRISSKLGIKILMPGNHPGLFLVRDESQPSVESGITIRQNREGGGGMEFPHRETYQFLNGKRTFLMIISNDKFPNFIIRCGGVVKRLRRFLVC